MPITWPSEARLLHTKYDGIDYHFHQTIYQKKTDFMNNITKYVSKEYDTIIRMFEKLQTTKKHNDEERKGKYNLAQHIATGQTLY